MLKKDFLRNKVIAITLFAFIMLAALLVAGAAGIITALFGAMDSLFEKASIPHFVQMHTGEVMDILSDINCVGTTILLVTHDAKVAAKTERVLFMTDGMIVGEKNLDKYHGVNEDVRMQESQLSAWLSEMGF